MGEGAPARKGEPMIEVTIADVARLIRDMTARERGDLVEELERLSTPRVRCPSRDVDTGARCVRDEGHDFDHVGANGASWLVALRCCLLGSDEHGMLCDRLAGHEGACVPQPRGARPQAAEPAPAPAPAPAEAPRARGVCVCGARRVEHFRFIGGCGRTGCQKYQGTTRRRW